MSPLKKQVRVCTILGLGLFASIAGFVYAFLRCLKYAWLTATPSSVPHNLAQHRSNLWFWVSVGMGIVMCVLVTRIFDCARKIARLRRAHGACQVCGYDRTASPGPCPECGSSAQPRP
jgi:hypothetical protein